ncbi:MAG TPA: hypothetical protein VG125_29165 [Pirellulales bacterium]|jgi:hypothetical protein|nr:hypothetical protein [Pirellulales bacterium]
MSNRSNDLEKLLEPSATKAFQDLVSNLRETLLAEASRQSAGNAISEDDLVLAYKTLSYPSKDSIQFADAQRVISQALRENRMVEWVSYGMAIILFVFGLVLMTAGIVREDAGTRVGALVGGSIVELLILIPFRFAINSRRHNIALRMTGLIINRVDDPKKLAPLLKDTFMAVVLGAPRFEVSGD